jgi:hypothetical protein
MSTRKDSSSLTTLAVAAAAEVETARIKKRLRPPPR